MMGAEGSPEKPDMESGSERRLFPVRSRATRDGSRPREVIASGLSELYEMSRIARDGKETGVRRTEEILFIAT